jgi:hypothetical protein
VSRWRKYSERIISEVETKHGIAWDTDATIFLLSFFIEQVSTQRQFRQFLERLAKQEKEALMEQPGGKDDLSICLEATQPTCLEADLSALHLGRPGTGNDPSFSSQ